MKKAVRGGLTYANVTSTMALFIALGGSAFAALTINGADVVDGSLTGRDIRNGSLGHADLKDQLAVTSRRRGRRGARGPRGRPGVTRVIVREGPPTACVGTNCSTLETTNTAVCESGQQVIGGGAAAPQNAALVASGPSPTTSGSTPTAWEARARAFQGALQEKPQVWALCASP